MRESLRFSGQLVCCTVSKTAHAWYAAITVETPDVPAKSESQAAVGIDLGVSTLATLSTDGKFDGPKALGCLLQRLRRLSRAHSRKAKGSANRRKSAQRLARLHWRIANVRADAIHKMTNALTQQYAWIAIEDSTSRGCWPTAGYPGTLRMLRLERSDASWPTRRSNAVWIWR